MSPPTSRFFLATLLLDFLSPPVSCTLFCPWLPMHVAISQVSEAVPSVPTYLPTLPLGQRYLAACCAAQQRGWLPV